MASRTFLSLLPEDVSLHIFEHVPEDTVRSFEATSPFLNTFVGTGPLQVLVGMVHDLTVPCQRKSSTLVIQLGVHRQF